MAKKLTKLTLKFSILGGAIYATADQGLWNDTDKADEVWNTLYQNICPYFKELPVASLPKIPSTDCIAKASREYYNKGVLATFNFLQGLPSQVSQWTLQGSNYLYETLQSASNGSSEEESGRKE